MISKPPHTALAQTASHTSRPARLALLCLAIGTIFIADTLTDYEIAVAVFYVTTVLIASAFLSVRGVLACSIACCALTICSVILNDRGAYQAGLINCMLSICAISATTYLALQRSSALQAEQTSRSQLVRLSRVSTLGELATSIAHEVKQPLTGIVASASACRNWLSSEPPNVTRAEQAVARIIADAGRACGIVDRVRKLSKRASPEAEWVDAEILVADVVSLCRRELDRHDISIVTEVIDGPAIVFADVVQIQQVLINLILNALEAMAGTKRSSAMGVTIGIAMQEENAQITIADTGPGIDGHRLDEIFDPFYSSKEDGIGLGLAISRSIIESHGGRIWAKSDLVSGAKFIFTLPARQIGETQTSFPIATSVGRRDSD